MRLELFDATHEPYYTVAVDAGELQTARGKRLPYKTWVGLVRAYEPFAITVWYPAAPVPRGYRAAAMRFLQLAQAEIREGSNARILLDDR